MLKSDVIKQITVKYSALVDLMDERLRRQWAAAEAQAYGWGGLQAISAAISMSPNTIRNRLRELDIREKNTNNPIPIRLRKEGGGRKSCTANDPGITAILEQLIEPMTRRDPMSPLRWTCLSTNNLDSALTKKGHPISPRTVGRLLGANGYSL